MSTLTWWRQVLRRAGVDAIRVSTGAPYLEELIRFFRMRERRMATA